MLLGLKENAAVYYAHSHPPTNLDYSWNKIKLDNTPNSSPKVVRFFLTPTNLIMANNTLLSSSKTIYYDQNSQVYSTYCLKIL